MSNLPPYLSRLGLLTLFGATAFLACSKGTPASTTGSSNGASSGGGPASDAGTAGSGGSTGAVTTGTGGSVATGTGGAVSEDAGAGDAGDAGPGVTAGGVTLPAGWTLKGSDRFGTAAGNTVTTMAELHAKYYEGQFYNRDASGLVLIPNVVINGEQETYEHFETAIVFSADHLTIQGRGEPDGGITSGEMVSIYTARSFCHEARYRIPSQDKSWPAFWFYGSTSASDKSEIDVEQPITPNQGVTSVSMYNHPSTADVVIVDPLFTTAYMTWTNPAFDGSAAPHVYTACYDDAASTITRYIDGKEIYSGTFKWNASLGGTGHGPDATTIFNLAVGGDWPGNLTNPAAYSADLDLYYIDYYGP